MGSLPDLPSPPFIHVEGLPNFRDLGGYPVEGQPGKVVRRGVVFRASEPSKLTAEGVAKLQALGITHVYDLRSIPEVDRSVQQEGGAVREWDGAERVFIPIFLEEDYSPEAIALRYKDFAAQGTEGFVRAYSRILHLGGKGDHPFTPFPTILKHLAGTDTPDTAASSQGDAAAVPSPMLIHCTAGKDRTGVICALILSLCGVSDEAVSHEYSLTDMGLASRREEFIGNLVKSDALRGDREAAARMIGSRKENMLETLATLRATYGSVERYMIDHCGLTSETVARIRRNLVVDADADAHGPVDWESHANLLVAYL